MARKNKKKLTISVKHGEAMRLTRVSIGHEKLVYAIVADKRLKYAKGKSRVVYFGTTKQGVARVAHSVAYHAEAILGRWGVRSCHVRIITCKPKQKVKTWVKLERALLLEFRKRYGDVPKQNTKGKRMKETDEFRYFRRKRVQAIIDELS